MSAWLVQTPIYAVFCDAPGCTERFVATGKFSQQHENPTRDDARKAGWKVRPFRGEGARSAPDLCPGHAHTT